MAGLTFPFQSCRCAVMRGGDQWAQWGLSWMESGVVAESERRDARFMDVLTVYRHHFPDVTPAQMQRVPS